VILMRTCPRLLPMLPICRLDVDFAQHPPTSCWCRPTGDQQSVVGTFPIAGARIWNSLPSDVTSAPSLAVFRRRLKTELFRRCYNVA